MGEIRQEFLRQTILNLETLQTEFNGCSPDSLCEDFLRRFFRTLHTIKGTSNTFNLFYLAKLAHEIENLLQAIQKNQISQNDITALAFQDSFIQLLKTAQDYKERKPILDSTAFIGKLRNLLPETPESNDLLIFQIPNRILAKLSTTELDVLSLALQKGKTFYLLRVIFPLQSFYEDFKNFKESLLENGEVIAIASATNKNPHSEMNFQVYFASNLEKQQVVSIINRFSAQIEFENISETKNQTDDLADVLANLVNYGRKTAQFLNKTITFETQFSEAQISTTHLILLNDIASHLLHNAIDHAIEPLQERSINGKNPVAKIKIRLENKHENLLFEIEDDGYGIDVERIISIGKEKGLISNEAISDENEALKLIFAQGFSTSETISEISGRGVGLDAVKDLVEGAGGRIEVESKRGLGSIFSVYLPQN